jgi:hypothetical protein
MPLAEKRKVVLVAIAMVIVVAPAVAVAVLVAGSGGGRASEKPQRTTGDRDNVRGNFSLSQARSFKGFPLYVPAPSAVNLPLTHASRVLWERDPRFPRRMNFVSFSYGQCDAPCAPPLAIQIWPACERYPTMYDIASDEVEHLTVRGVAADLFEAGRRLEISTSSSTIVIFGESRDHVLAVAGSLKPLNVEVAGKNLPPPVAGAREGRLKCSYDR